MKATLVRKIVDFKPTQHLDKKIHETATEVLTQWQFKLDPGLPTEDNRSATEVIVAISQPCVLPNVLRNQQGETIPQPMRPSVGLILDCRARNRTVMSAQWFDNFATPTPIAWLQKLGYEVIAN